MQTNNFYPFLNSEYTPKAIINLNALNHNAKVIQTAVNQPICGVIKSNAYGHGLVKSAFAIKNYCSFFAVCSLSEGIELRLAGITKPILCLLPINNILRANYYKITPTVHSVNYFKKVNAICKTAKISLGVHIAVNTGMNRLGLNNLSELSYCLNNQEWVKVQGLFSHFYNAKSLQDCTLQYNKFLPFVSYAKGKNNKIIAHISSSASVSLTNKFNLDMVRIGLLMYGYNAINGTFRLKKAMKVVAPTICKRHFLKGDNLLYGNYKMQQSKRVLICAYGYANGFRSPLNSQFNNSCMNVSALSKNLLFTNAQKLAKELNTNEYDILTRFGNGCEKIYKGSF